MSKPIRIRRATKDKDHPYKSMRRATFDGCGLSFEARGVLAYVLMKPDDWVVNVPDLMREGGIGRDKAYRIIDELIAAGYAERVDGRDNHGKFGSNTILIYEQPCTEKPDTAEPDTAEPDTENTEHTNKGKELKKEKKLSKEPEKAQAPKPHEHQLVQAYRDFHERLPTKAQMKLIVERDPPIEDWVRAIRAWSGRGYSPTNIDGMLEWAENPRLIDAKSGSNAQHRRSTNRGLNAAMDYIQERGMFNGRD